MRTIFHHLSIAIFVILCAFGVSRPSSAFAAVEQDPYAVSLEDLLKMSWAASNHGDYEELERITKAILAQHEQEAMAQSTSLSAFPSRDKVDDFRIMNNVATALFVHAESLMHRGLKEEAIAAFERLIKDYPYAQSWDASRGAFWSIAEKSKISICVIKGGDECDQGAPVSTSPATKPSLATPGTDDVIDYASYGVFSGIGTRDYKYTVTNPNVLLVAVGEGIFPNTGGVLKNPLYKEAFQAGRLSGTHWDFVNTPDLGAAYFKWATAPESPGIKLFYTGITFEKAGMYLEAVKAYHALIVHFPRTVGMTYWQTPWYPAQAAVGKIRNILRQHPELGYEYVGGKVRVLNGDDNDTKNDIFIIWPGEIRKKIGSEPARRKLGKPRRFLGGKKTKLIQYESGDWRMFVAGKPIMIKAITYMPTKVGQSPDNGTLENWMMQDGNHNGKPDSPYDSWVDKNQNNVQDADEPVVGDFQLMKEMGVNAIRVYNLPNTIDKKVLRDLYDNDGIMVIMEDFLGKYAIGSGADWATGTDYENPVHLKNMMEKIEQMVNEYKNEPYIMFWLLGNENNYGVASNADKKPVAYYKFVNAVAKRIKELDPDRPVAICNGDILYLDKFAKNAPEVDIFGANVYRGDYGFASYWDEVRRVTNKPAFITEYGAPAYSKMVSLDEAEEQQASYHRGALLDIEANSAGYAEGEGNALGGISFEWMDEWWKNYEPAKHDTKADVVGPFAGGYYFEEWFGLVGQGDGKSSPFLRHLRKSYYVYKSFWNK
ncbi:MAG: tetratricopeptide repeat protein [Candidatus Omnitrophica bacterium]|nr:tetratricopeptide repeat protein [Candidatus Omnitrophota bacterium]